ncbi:MAG: sigma-70 family RNA polymerase sigma factor [Verrucomicrobia bacterium]|nr:sigma-70 family RNA polymerase sigma factor [Verrucomicrobiota bacterium]
MRTTMGDWQLLQAYAKNHSEAAFAELVRLHLDWVSTVALRHVGDRHQAEDVVQSVFVLLARKARDLGPGTSVGGWLFRTTHLVAGHARRAELRRKSREATACTMNPDTASADTDEILWQQLAPQLDQAVAALAETDRSAILLRFYERLSLGEVGERLGVTEEAAKKRVSRAVEKLREFLDRRGVKLSGIALTAILAEKTVQTASAALAGTVIKISLAAASASASTMLPHLARETLRAWHLAKLKLVAGLGVGSFALIFMAVTASGLLTRHAAPQAVAAIASPAALSSTGAPVADPNSLAAAAPTARGDALELRIVAADTGKPVPSVTVLCDLIEATNYSHHQYQATRLGACEVPVPRNTVTRLVLCSQIEGFADTWLQWLPDRGDQIPMEYTLRLIRAVQIGGQVVDSDGQPVAGARVVFGADGFGSALADARPETHVAAAITAVPTDTAGRWSLGRIAPEVYHRVKAAASHPEHVSTRISIADDPAAEKQLLAGTYVFRLGRAVTLSGVVLDPDNHPVPEARVSIRNLPNRALPSLQENQGFFGMRRATNQADGAFILTGCEPGNSEITVQAAGFVSTKMEVDSETNSPPLRITLQHGKVLRLHVVDQKGAPVPKAEVEVTDSRTLLRTDAEGRLQWAGAAAEAVPLQVRASGYMWIDDFIVKADGQEHLITLSPLLTISGTVRDAATGRPVPHFRIISGWPRLTPFTHTTNIQWQSASEASWISSPEGKFRQPVAEAVSQNTSIAFKFDAEGYAPFVTRAVRADEGEVQFDVALRPSAP